MVTETRHETYTRRTGTQFVARCSCGWSSKCMDTEAHAEDEATDHVVAVTPSHDPADDLDYCGLCNGSGEGVADGTRCSRCKGRGMVAIVPRPGERY